MNRSPTAEAAEMERLFDRLWPLLRSITGAGVRETHDILGELVSLDRLEVPSGTPVLDWTVPKEWVVRDAHVIAPDGRRILDVRAHTLHLVGYSTPFRGRMSRSELDEHLISDPKQPDAIPYATSYYAPRWGFCIAHRERMALEDGEYEVVVDTEHVDGSLTISEAVLPGEDAHVGEVLLSADTCHPSLANNELSGPIVLAHLARRLAAWPKRRLTYRFVFLPESIGSITYLHLRGAHLRDRLVAGYVVTCIGDAGAFTYKRSRRGDSDADRAAELVLAGHAHEVLDFFPDAGSDERQFCSPGFDLPVGSLMRTRYGEYPEYHTSLDDKQVLSFPSMVEAVDVYEEVLSVLDANITPRSTAPFGEPQLGRRGLYRTLSGKNEPLDSALLWVLNLADGDHDLIDIANRSGQPFRMVAEAAERLVEAGLLVSE